MTRKCSDSGWRAAAFAAALFAITLNFLQPLAHAALMRGGGTEAAAKMWGTFCLPVVGQDDADAPLPSVGKSHECCLGLAHAPVLAELSPSFTLIQHVAVAIRFVAATDVHSPVGIRDGPGQPRAPPAIV
jgi:hypothetical protein